MPNLSARSFFILLGRRRAPGEDFFPDLDDELDVGLVARAEGYDFFIRSLGEEREGGGKR